MLILGLLGFTNIPHAFPINDKVLHFVCFTIATGVFYFIFDVEEDARRIWLWRNVGLITTGILCFFFGGIMSEVIQSLLPYKTFQMGDVIANLLGSSLGLFVSYNLEKYYRRRREIARLYQPLDQLPEDMPSDDEDEPMLPMYHKPSQPQPSSAKKARQEPRLGNVWDSREEVFEIGDDDDDEEEEDQSGRAERKMRAPNTQRSVHFN